MIFQDELSKRKERRNYRKRRHKSTGRGGVTGPGASAPLSSSVSSSHARGSGAGHGREGGGHGRDGGGGREGGREVGGGGGSGGGGLTCFSDQASAGSSEDEAESVVAASHSEADEAESDIEKQGPFAFRRKLHCSYLAVSLFSKYFQRKTHSIHLRNQNPVIRSYLDFFFISKI